MEYALTIIAVVSAAIALAMTAIVVRMLRDERRRSDARVEALVRLANSGGTGAPLVTSPQAVRFDPDDFPSEPVADLDLQPAVAGVGGLFAEPEQSSPWLRRLSIAASVALLAGLLGFSVRSFTRTVHTDGSVPSVAEVEAADASPVLELLTLTYEHQGDSLTITGIVQNPKSSASPISGVEATALLFGSTGAVVASARAPIDFSRLRPGEESPFVLRVPVKGTVARYRVGFRGGDGHVIAHVDRRAAGPLARNE